MSKSLYDLWKQHMLAGGDFADWDFESDTFKMSESDRSLAEFTRLQSEDLAKWMVRAAEAEDRAERLDRALDQAIGLFAADRIAGESWDEFCAQIKKTLMADD